MDLDSNSIAFGMVPLVLGTDGRPLRTVRDGVDYNRQQGIRQQSGMMWEDEEEEEETGMELFDKPPYGSEGNPGIYAVAIFRCATDTLHPLYTIRHCTTLGV